MKSCEKYFGTWIWDAIKVDVKSKICQQGDDNCVALISSENKVLVWNLSNDKVHTISSCVEQCILYLFTILRNYCVNRPFLTGLLFKSSESVFTLFSMLSEGF